jgi:hypothetical protein
MSEKAKQNERKEKRRKRSNGREGGLDDTIRHGVLPDELAVVVLSEIEALKAIQQSGELGKASKKKLIISTTNDEEKKSGQ